MLFQPSFALVEWSPFQNEEVWGTWELVGFCRSAACTVWDYSLPLTVDRQIDCDLQPCFLLATIEHHRQELSFCNSKKINNAFMNMSTCKHKQQRSDKPWSWIWTAFFCQRPFFLQYGVSSLSKTAIWYYSKFIVCCLLNNFEWNRTAIFNFE